MKNKFMNIVSVVFLLLNFPCSFIQAQSANLIEGLLN